MFQWMKALQAGKTLEDITTILATSQRGIHKRIDENRELLEFLREKAPDLLKDHFWVEGWLDSQDVFLNDLLEVSKIPNPLAYSAHPYPRPWPGGKRIERPVDMAIILDVPASNDDACECWAFCECHGREFVQVDAQGTEFCSECIADGRTGELCFPSHTSCILNDPKANEFELQFMCDKHAADKRTIMWELDVENKPTAGAC